MSNFQLDNTIFAIIEKDVELDFKFNPCQPACISYAPCDLTNIVVIRTAIDNIDTNSYNVYLKTETFLNGIRKLEKKYPNISKELNLKYVFDLLDNDYGALSNRTCVDYTIKTTEKVLISVLSAIVHTTDNAELHITRDKIKYTHNDFWISWSLNDDHVEFFSNDVLCND